MRKQVFICLSIDSFTLVMLVIPHFYTTFYFCRNELKEHLLNTILCIHLNKSLKHTLMYLRLKLYHPFSCTGRF